MVCCEQISAKITNSLILTQAQYFMKFLFDFLPILLFFIAFKIPDDPKEGIMLATAVAIAVSIAQVTYNWFRHHKVEKMHLITMGLIVILGGATLLLQD